MPSGNWNGRKRNCFVRPISSEASIDWGLPTCPRWNPSGNASGGWIVPSASNEHILKTLRIATIVPLVYILIVACRQKQTCRGKSNFDSSTKIHKILQPKNRKQLRHLASGSKPTRKWSTRSSCHLGIISWLVDGGQGGFKCPQFTPLSSKATCPDPSTWWSIVTS